MSTPEATPAADRLMTTDEVAARTRVAPGTLRWWRHTGKQGPKSFTLGSRVVYKSSDVEAWITTQYTDASGVVS
jgi:predicted DNA-binding transcriptional regulator AlpA